MSDLPSKERLEELRDALMRCEEPHARPEEWSTLLDCALAVRRLEDELRGDEHEVVYSIGFEDGQFGVVLTTREGVGDSIVSALTAALDAAEGGKT